MGYGDFSKLLLRLQIFKQVIHLSCICCSLNNIVAVWYCRLMICNALRYNNVTLTKISAAMMFTLMDFVSHTIRIRKLGNTVHVKDVICHKWSKAYCFHSVNSFLYSYSFWSPHSLDGFILPTQHEGFTKGMLVMIYLILTASLFTVHCVYTVRVVIKLLLIQTELFLLLLVHSVQLLKHGVSFIVKQPQQALCVCHSSQQFQS